MSQKKKFWLKPWFLISGTCVWMLSCLAILAYDHRPDLRYAAEYSDMRNDIEIISKKGCALAIADIQPTHRQDQLLLTLKNNNCDEAL